MSASAIQTSRRYASPANSRTNGSMAALILSGTFWIALTARACAMIGASGGSSVMTGASGSASSGLSSGGGGLTNAALIVSMVSGSLALTKVAPMSPGHSTRQAVHAGGSVSFGLYSG